MSSTYREENGYLIPNLTLPDEEGENRYLYVAFIGDSIVYCDVLSDFAYIQEVWKEKSSDN